MLTNEKTTMKIILILFALSSLIIAENKFDKKELLGDVRRNLFNPTCLARLSKAALTPKDQVNNDTFGGGNQLQDLSDCDCIAMMKWFIMSGADVNKVGANRKKTLLEGVLDNKEQVELILDAGAGSEHIRKALLKAIIQRSSLDIIVILLEKEKDENVKLNLLETASEAGNIDAFSLICPHCDLKSEKARDIFKRALLDKDLEKIKLIVKNGFDTNRFTFDGEGKTYLHLAAKYIREDSFNNREIFKILIDNTANLDATNDSGESALHVAARYKNAFVVNLLLSYGANKNLKDQQGNTPMDHCISGNIMIEPKNVR